MSAGWAAFAAVLGANALLTGFLALRVWRQSHVPGRRAFAGRWRRSRSGPVGTRARPWRRRSAPRRRGSGWRTSGSRPSCRSSSCSPCATPAEAGGLSAAPGGGRLRGAGGHAADAVLRERARASTTRGISAILGRRGAARGDRRTLVPRADGALVPPHARGHRAHPAGDACGGRSATAHRPPSFSSGSPPLGGEPLLPRGGLWPDLSFPVDFTPLAFGASDWCTARGVPPAAVRPRAGGAGRGAGGPAGRW